MVSMKRLYKELIVFNVEESGVLYTPLYSDIHLPFPEPELLSISFMGRKFFICQL